MTFSDHPDRKLRAAAAEVLVVLKSIWLRLRDPHEGTAVASVRHPRCVVALSHRSQVGQTNLDQLEPGLFHYIFHRQDYGSILDCVSQRETHSIVQLPGYFESKQDAMSCLGEGGGFQRN